MKTRLDFVSNSSSSSHIVIVDTGTLNIPKLSLSDIDRDCDGCVVLPNVHEGESQFGWQTEEYSDFWSKANWAAILALEQRNVEKHCIADPSRNLTYSFDSMEKLLKLIFKDKLGIDVRLMTPKEEETKWVYIDHQSGIGECIENAAMFDSYSAMENWLFRDSYIVNGNDNG